MSMELKIASGVGILIMLLVLGSGIYFFSKYQSSQKELQSIKTAPGSVQGSGQDEVVQLVGEVGKLIALPTGEQPTVATITDITKLKDQAFFNEAKNGDKVLIYTNAKKAILYDPGQNKVIDIAPLNIGSSSAQVAAVQPRLDIRNGTSTPGLTSVLQASLLKVDPNADVVAKDNSKKTDYLKTIVVSLDPKFNDAASNIAQLLGVTVSALPQGETKAANADVMVIIGQDKVPTPSPTAAS